MLPSPPRRASVPAGVALVLATLVLAALSAGCSGPLVRDAPDVERPGAFPNHGIATILSAVRSQAEALESFESRSRIAVERPGQRATLTARLRQSPDSLYGTLTGPFGIFVGEGLVTPDSFYVDYRFGRAYYLGPLAAAARVVPVPPTSTDLFASLTGTVAPNPALDWTASHDSLRYVLDARVRGTDEVVQRLVVDPALWQVVEATDYGLDGTILGTRSFSAFDQIDGLVLPRRVTLRAPQEDATVTIEHLSVTVNPAPLSFPRPDVGGSEVTLIE